VLTVPDGKGREDMYSLSDEVMNRILEIDAVETVGAMSISEGREGTDNAWRRLLIIKLHSIYC
jgi:hypothetical protein